MKNWIGKQVKIVALGYFEDAESRTLDTYETTLQEVESSGVVVQGGQIESANFYPWHVIQEIILR